jgi:hypothetical protein
MESGERNYEHLLRHMDPALASGVVGFGPLAGGRGSVIAGARSSRGLH